MKHCERLMILSVLLASCSGSEEPEERPALDAPYSAAGERPSVHEMSLVTTTATVEAIDHESRKITLRGPHGNRLSFKVDDRVKNLKQVKVGDRVVVDYYESLAIELVKPGTSADRRDTVVQSAEPGEKPAGAVVEKSVMTATIEQIDRTVPSITLRDQEGDLRTFKVRHPERLRLVKVGDTLRITYMQAVAVSVEPAPPGAD